jgi:hypothetical protein
MWDPWRLTILLVCTACYRDIILRFYFTLEGWVDPVPDPLLLRKSGSAGNRIRDLWVSSQELWRVDHRGGQSFCHSEQYALPHELVVSLDKPHINRILIFIRNAPSVLFHGTHTKSGQPNGHNCWLWPGGSGSIPRSVICWHSPQSPDWLWGSLSLLSSGTRAVFPSA